MDDYVAVIDPDRLTLKTTISLTSTPSAIAIAPNQQELYIPSRRSSSPLVVDAVHSVETAVLPAGTLPSAAAVSANGLEVFVANGFLEGDLGNSISVIETTTGSIVGAIPGMADPHSMALNAAASELYVGNLLAADVAVIDTTSRTIVARIPVNGRPWDLAIAKSRNRLYISDADSNENNLAVVDLGTLAIVERIPQFDPLAIALTPDESTLYVANLFSRSIDVIDTASLVVIDTIRLTMVPGSMRVTPDGSRLFVSHSTRNRITVVDISTRRVTDEIDAVTRPSDLAFLDSRNGCSFACPGDCNGDGSVGLDEIIRGVSIGLGRLPIGTCEALDGDSNGLLQIAELVVGVDRAMRGCDFPS